MKGSNILRALTQRINDLETRIADLESVVAELKARKPFSPFELIGRRYIPEPALLPNIRPWDPLHPDVVRPIRTWEPQCNPPVIGDGEPPQVMCYDSGTGDTTT